MTTRTVGEVKGDGVDLRFTAADSFAIHLKARGLIAPEHFDQVRELAVLFQEHQRFRGVEMAYRSISGALDAIKL